MNKRRVIDILLILIIGIVVYVNSFGNEFVWDDDYLIVNNTFIKDWRYLSKIFTSNLFAGSWKDSSFYRPIQSLTLLVDYSIWHLNPSGYHLTNILIHIANAVLIYWLAVYLLAGRGVAIFAALLFLVHPVQTEAVTYISGRADPLAAFFLLSAFIFFIKGRKTGSLFCFILALLSKEVCLIFPLLILAYCLLDNNKITLKNKFLPIAPFFIAASVYLLTRSLLLDFLKITDLTSNTPLFTRLIIACKTFVHYLGFIVFPSGLHMERSLYIKGYLLEPDIWASLLLLIVFTALIVKLAKRHKVISFGLAWFIIGLLPTSGIMPVNAFIAEHWLYIPSIGLFLAISSYAAQISSRKHQKTGLIMFILILAVFSMLTIRQNTVWKDKETLYKYILKLNPESSRAHFNLGSTYGEKNLDDMAIPEFKKTIELKPDYIDAYVNLGYTYQKQGRFEEAAQVFKKAVTIAPNSYLPGIYFDLGRAHDKTGNKEEAIKAYQKCIELSPSRVDAYLNLGSIFAENRQFDQAKIIWEKGLKYDPQNSDIKQNLTELRKILY